MADIRLPPAEELARRWAEIEPILRRSTVRTDGCYEPIDVFRMAMAGQVAFWLIEEGEKLLAIAVTELRQYPRKLVLDIPFVAGVRLSDWWAAFVSKMDEHAARCGCAAITSGCGRPGWERFWSAHGVEVKVMGSCIVRKIGVTQTNEQ